MLAKIIMKMFALSLLVGAVQLIPQQAEAQTQGYYGIKHPQFSMGNSSFHCDPFYPSTISRYAYVAINETKSFSWWATCTSGSNVIRIDLSYTVTGSSTRLVAGQTAPKSVAVRAVAKLSYNGKTCETLTENYNWDLINNWNGYINQIVQDWNPYGCSGTWGTVDATEHIGGTN